MKELGAFAHFGSIAGSFIKPELVCDGTPLSIPLDDAQVPRIIGKAGRKQHSRGDKTSNNKTTPDAWGLNATGFEIRSPLRPALMD